MSAKKKVKSGVYVWVVRVLALVGFGMMVYLANLHFSSGLESGAVCELGEGVSCEAVNSSKYSEIFGIPVAFLGLGYFGLLFLATLGKFTKDRATQIFYFTLFVLVPSLYLTSLELFVINSICIFCELSKLTMLVVLVYTGFELRKHGVKIVPKSVFGVILIGLIAAGFTWFFQSQSGADSRDLAPLAQCITENEVVMYGSITCTACAREKEIFGDAFAHITEVECNPRGEHAQTDLCLQLGIEHTPTFIKWDGDVEVDRVQGLQTPNDLAKFSGCESTLENL